MSCNTRDNCAAEKTQAKSGAIGRKTQIEAPVRIGNSGVFLDKVTGYERK